MLSEINCPDDSPIVTSGLVVTFDPCESDAAVAAIAAVPDFTIGDPNGSRLPLALEALDAAESERWCEWLRALPGVTGVEVIFVHWDEVEHGAR